MSWSPRFGSLCSLALVYPLVTGTAQSQQKMGSRFEAIEVELRRIVDDCRGWTLAMDAENEDFG